MMYDYIRCKHEESQVVQQWIGDMKTFNHGTLQEDNDSELIQSSYAKSFANKTSTFISNTYSILHPHGAELSLFRSSYNHNEGLNYLLPISMKQFVKVQ
jgi:hypothetical protein